MVIMASSIACGRVQKTATAELLKMVALGKVHLIWQGEDEDF